MKVLFFSVFILLGLSSCKKETFTPCDGFEELYGEWASIDADVDGYLKLGFKDRFEYRSTLDRDIKKRMTSCFEISSPLLIDGQLWNGYGVYLDEQTSNDGYVLILFSSQKDTIMFGAAAFNTSEYANYRQRFIRKK
jgi:hypothetical protein